MGERTIKTQPKAQSYIIKRPRLTKLLDESGARIILLCAPAGYGKTTLAREWTSSRVEPVAWYRAGPNTCDVADFACDLADLFASVSDSPGSDVIQDVRRLAAGREPGHLLARALRSGSPTDAARTNLVGNPVLPKDERTFSTNVNATAFALPAAGTLGNAAKAVFRGPGRNNWDVSTFKNFMLSERVRAQFRFEAYNLFNHTQFTTLDTTIRFANATGALQPTTFGQFTAAGLARRMQVAMRVNF